MFGGQRAEQGAGMEGVAKRRGRAKGHGDQGWCLLLGLGRRLGLSRSGARCLGDSELQGGEEGAVLATHSGGTGPLGCVHPCVSMWSWV